jgi:dipeptidyl aminopeptidase/acylaminoacyl peptidase
LAVGLAAIGAGRPTPSLGRPRASAPAATTPASPDARALTDARSISSPANPDARPVPIDDLFFTRNAYGGAWSPDGRDVVFTSDISGRLNLWKVPAAGGWPVQLAQSDDAQRGAAWSPDGKWIVFEQDRGGNELYDLYAIPSAGGQVVNLTQTPDVREYYARWSPDGKTIAFSRKAASDPVRDIALIDWASHGVRRLTREATTNHSWSAVAWSPDGKTIYANRQDISFLDSDVYSIDVATGQLRNLTHHQGNVINNSTSLSPDGKALLLSSNEKGGFKNVALLDVATGKRSWITDVKWNAEARDFSPDGKWVTYVISADGRTEAFIADRSSGAATRIAMPPGVNFFDGNPGAFSPGGDRLLVSHESATEPSDLWIYDIRKRAPRQLTISTIASLQATPLPQAQIVHYQSFDGKTISALLWMPFNLKRDASNPAIVYPHGGPTGQISDYWFPDVTALVSRGYTVIAPNVRGSTGYGIEFQRANYQDLGGGDLQDEIHAVELLKRTGYIDPRKIGITGGSYGGFMTLMAIGKTPEVWSAAVALYGIIDWITMVKFSDPMLQQYVKSLLGDPEKDLAVYQKTSPIKYLNNAKAPLLILQGDNDVRVPKEEAQQVVNLLQKGGKIVQAHYYADEGHGFVKRENQIDAIKRSIDWLDRYLKGNAAASSP